MSYREVMTVRLYRENKHITPSLSRDVADVVGVAVLAFIGCVLAVLLMGGL